jgi:hypothetical protein
LTVTDVYNFRAINPTITATPTLTNVYGLFVPDLTTGVNNWSIYSLGGNMAHAGNVRIGDTTAPTEALEVNGNIVQNEANGSRYLLRYSLMGV